MSLPKAIQRARWWVCHPTRAPYLAPGIWTLRPIECPGLGTIAVDERWRMYYDPASIAEWAKDDAVLGTLLVHELSHLLRKHPDRLRMFPRDIANAGADAEINDDLGGAPWRLPEDAVTPETLGMPSGKLAEWYIGEMMRRQQGQAGDQGQGQGQGQEEGEGQGEGQGQGQARPDGRGGRGARPRPAAGRCGSCATGQREPWEMGPDGDGRPETEPVDPVRREMIARTIAREIIEHEKSRGNVPAGLSRWAREKLAPKRIPWDRLLRGAVTSAVRYRSGLSCPTYRRPSRRAVAGLLLPDTERPVPDVAMVIDTSGSMSDDELALAAGTIESACDAMGMSPMVIACDADVHRVERHVRGRRVDTSGGGGTDMRVGISHAESLRPRPSVVVVITDGYTPWPETPPRRMSVVVATTGRRGPMWARNIQIERKE